MVEGDQGFRRQGRIACPAAANGSQTPSRRQHRLLARSRQSNKRCSCRPPISRAHLGSLQDESPGAETKWHDEAFPKIAGYLTGAVPSVPASTVLSPIPLSAVIASSGNWSAAEARFSRRWRIEDVPGIKRMLGAR
jgi:hypothetical protein